MNRLFLGSPGTGKTTCAKIYGKILKALGYLSNGEVISKTASDFIGNVVGDSHTKTSQILNLSKGKVLIIDEAYNLNNNIYGSEVLDTIVEKVQGNPGDDIALLLLGYESQIVNMIRTQNPGLSSRFPIEHAFRFEDYTNQELLKIFTTTCKDKKVRMNQKVAQKAIKILSKQRRLTNFGNVRSVLQLIDKVISKCNG